MQGKGSGVTVLSMRTGMRPGECQMLHGCWGWAGGGFTVRVQAEEPVLFLLVGADVDEGRGPVDAVGVLELLEHDLHRLAVRRVLGDEV